jgi:ribosomal protein S6--L-glutamate ligase
MTEEVRNICCAASECLNLDYCAIDLLLSDRGPLLLEVNSGAGLTGIEEFTGVNVPKLFGDYLVELYNKTKKEA